MRRPERQAQYECTGHPNGHGHNRSTWPSCMWCGQPMFIDPDTSLYVRRSIIREMEEIYD